MKTHFLGEAIKRMQYSMVNQVMKIASAIAKSWCSLVSFVSGSVTCTNIEGQVLNVKIKDMNDNLESRDGANDQGQGGDDHKSDRDNGDHLKRKKIIIFFLFWSKWCKIHIFSTRECAVVCRHFINPDI